MQIVWRHIAKTWIVVAQNHEQQKEHHNRQSPHRCSQNFISKNTIKDVIQNPKTHFKLRWCAKFLGWITSSQTRGKFVHPHSCSWTFQLDDFSHLSATGLPIRTGRSCRNCRALSVPSSLTATDFNLPGWMMSWRVNRHWNLLSDWILVQIHVEFCHVHPTVFSMLKILSKNLWIPSKMSFRIPRPISSSNGAPNFLIGSPAVKPEVASYTRTLAIKPSNLMISPTKITTHHT